MLPYAYHTPNVCVPLTCANLAFVNPYYQQVSICETRQYRKSASNSSFHRLNRACLSCLLALFHDIGEMSKILNIDKGCVLTDPTVFTIKSQPGCRSYVVQAIHIVLFTIVKTISNKTYKDYCRNKLVIFQDLNIYMVAKARLSIKIALIKQQEINNNKIKYILM